MAEHLLCMGGSDEPDPAGSDIAMLAAGADGAKAFRAESNGGELRPDTPPTA
ncbi:hypothetical protein GCM10010441_13660 [Kitasatospora paracochleata]